MTKTDPITAGDGPPPISLPFPFDTTGIWHTILKGAFGLNALMVGGVLFKLASRAWLDAGALVVVEAVVLSITFIVVRFQEGSRGTLFPDRVVVGANGVFGVPLPGPRGEYRLARFRGVRVEYRSGPVSASANAGGPNEVVWLVGVQGTPDVAIARTEQRRGSLLGRRLGTLLKLPLEEVSKPREIQLR